MVDVGAIIQGVGSAVGGLANYWSNYETNVTNKNLARETNQQNYRIWQEQLEAQRQQYLAEKMENRYLVDQAYERNLPKNVIKNLKEAGINPALAFESNAFSDNAVVGNNPSSSVPAAPSMVSPQMLPPNLSDIGTGLSRVAEAYYRDREEERSDYALAADITFRDRQSKIDLIKAAIQAKEAGVNERWVDSQIDDSNRNYYLNLDKFAVENEERQRRYDLDEARLQIEQREADIKEAAVQNEIRLSYAQISQINQLISESVQRVDNMRAEQDLSYKEYQKALRESLFNMKAELLRIGISEEELKSRKFKDFFGTIANSLITGAGVYYGLRGARAVGSSVRSSRYKGSPFKMEPYDPVKDTPWNSW